MTTIQAAVSRYREVPEVVEARHRQEESLLRGQKSASRWLYREQGGLHFRLNELGLRHRYRCRDCCQCSAFAS